MFKKKLSYLCVALSCCCLLLMSCGAMSNQSRAKNAPPSDEPQAGTPQPGRITVVTDKTQYTTHDAITVIVTNTFGHSVYLSPTGTNCSPLRLERWTNNNSWQLQGRCLTKQSAGTIRLSEGMTTMSPLTTSTGSIGRPLRSSQPAQWVPGTYRIVLLYQEQLDPDMVQGGSSVASMQFTIG